MKTSVLSLSGLLSAVSAFPMAAIQEAATNPKIAEFFAKRQSVATADAATYLFEPHPTFDAALQLIDVTGAHAFVPPGPNDLRGPCPGLNAFANHGYLPHNGYATIGQFIDATTQVVGMGPDLAGFLAVLGATVDGSGTAWSIGGTPPASVGLGNGISGSHNKYESDASPTRGDLYQAGEDYLLHLDQFQQLVNYGNNNITLDALTRFRSDRFDHQVATNPYFFNGPFTGVLVQPAAYTFIYRFMANHSAQNPVGYLNNQVLQSWFGVNGTSGSYTKKDGWEQIPANWYKRAPEYPYTIPYYTADLLNAGALHGKFFDIGGNTGTTNSFTGLNATSFTSGVYNAQTLSQGNNAACLAYQFAAQAKPDLALAAFTALDQALSSINSQLGCAQLEGYDEKQLEGFPGYSKNPVY